MVCAIPTKFLNFGLGFCTATKKFPLMQHFGQKKHLLKQETKPDETKPVEISSESALIDACIKGDRSAQKRMYDSLAPKMFAVCLRYMGNRQSAEDMLQEGFITLFGNLSKYSGTGSFEGWARKIFVNTALMSLRRTDALKMSDDLDTAWNLSSDTTTQIQNLGYKDLMKMIASLPDGYRTIFNMAVVEGYSHKEISDMLGISEATSRSQLHRARAMLQEKIRNL